LKSFFQIKIFVSNKSTTFDFSFSIFNFMIKAKKSFGQHFLTNESIAERIADGLDSNSDYKKVLEVGPGKGFLTKYLIGKPYELKVVEADRDMVDYLNLNYKALHGRIVSEDFLKISFAEQFGDDQFALIGNFPYNISSQIVIKMIENRSQIPIMVGMFQKEVGERIVAPPGGKDYGVLSVLAQAFYSGEYLFTVDRSNFAPPPKVQSGVIRLTRKANQELGCDHELFRTVVKTSFGQRRKMLRNTIKSLVSDEDFLANSFFNKRPEVLSVEEFVWLTQEIDRRNKK
jgi:16S rRNA (adenine1518-N6/adenine1519-N6)-dimethyltransferase